MLALRHIPAILAMAAIAGCVQQPLETVNVDGGLNVTEVTIAVAGDAASSQTVVTGRQAGIQSGQFRSDLDAELTSVLGQASDPAGTPVTVEVTVTEVYLAPPVERVVAGTSYIRGAVQVTDQQGRIVVRPTSVRGNTENIRLAGAFGLATTRSVQADYRGTLRGFAKTVRDALFGAPDA